MLCEVCLDFFRGSYPVDFSAHHDSIRSLQRSALEDCDICRIVWNGISRLSRSGSERVQISTKAKLRPYNDKGTEELRLEASSTAYTRTWRITCEPAGEYCKDPDADKPYDYSDWAASMACGRTWLAKCMENHTDCQVSRSSERTPRDTSGVSYRIGTSEPIAYRPTRLIEIGQPEADRVRLRLCSELDSSSPQYATLSHCWGTSKTLRLTSDSFQRLRNGVAVSELAKTFQDAIFTARSLGIKLLWIDSFCIFQDSKKDWQRESALMSQVYRHSFLNIAASIAADSDAGCFRKRASTVEPYLVQTAWTNRPNGTYYLYDRHYWIDNFKRMPLNQRAWVIQELTLPPRVLHLCGSQMFWECYGLNACEIWPTGLPPNMSISSVKSTSWAAAIDIFGFAWTNDIKTLRISTDKNELNTTTFRELWARIVSDYSKCDLTFPSDKLVALSGIAKHMEQLLDIEYCAGLWRIDLIPGLAWYADTQSVRQLEADSITYRAPSWSWACLDGPISWHGYHGMEWQPLVDIICCDVRTTTAERTGAVLGAALQISGWLATIELHPLGVTWKFRLDGRWNSLSRHNFNLDRRPPSSRLHCLPLFVEATRGQFRRIGIFQLVVEDLGLEDWNQFPRIKNASWLEYESASGDDKYTITII